MLRRLFNGLVAASPLLMAQKTEPGKKTLTNPFFEKWSAPHGLPPFDQILPEHFLPAFAEGRKRELAEVEAIVANPAPPDFANTIEAFDRKGELSHRVGNVFGNLNGSHTNPALQAVARENAPLRAKHESTIFQNAALFARIDAVYQKRAELGLGPEAMRLVEQTHKQFVRAGARLDAAKKGRLAEVDQLLASRTNQFEQNLLADTAGYELVLNDESELAGLPESVRRDAAETARVRGKAGKWVITLQRSSIEPFLQMSARRDLREKAFKAFALRGDNGNSYDNKALIQDIVQLRMERAQLLGYSNYAKYALDDVMAKTPERAWELMDQLWKPALAKARQEAAELAEAMGPGQTLEAWDWRYYAEKVRMAKYQIDEEQIKPYFPLDRMIEAKFWVAGELFGLRFEERRDLPKYQEDVRTWEVRARDGKFVGVFYGDYFARPSKRSGAWMSSFRRQQKLDGAVTPVIVNNLNLNKPPAGQPALLSYTDATTLFHEFGHALHGLLSNVTYQSLAGTSVARDFVELPSQIYEHWLGERKVLEKFARHYKTGEPIPAALLEKMRKADTFNVGFDMVEYLASAFVDLEWHALEKKAPMDVRAMEEGWLKKLGMPREIIMRHRSPHFSHIFGSPTGYAAGYYSYRWSAVLDNDGFAAFTEKGNAFDPEVAERLYRHIYSAGGTADPMELYKRFRGREPNTEALMKSLGFAGR